MFTDAHQIQIVNKVCLFFLFLKNRIQDRQNTAVTHSMWWVVIFNSEITFVDYLLFISEQITLNLNTIH